MQLNMNVIYKHFEYASSEMIDLVEDMLDRIDEDELKNDPYEAVSEAMDSGLIYTADEWTMIEHYCTPIDADFQLAWESFQNDLMACIEDGAIEVEEEDD